MANSIFDEIISSVDISEIIGNYLQLHRVGKDYKCLCPFHSDNNPSLHISPEKQIFKCFSCGHSGNAITFVRDYEKISFVDAARKVCQLANIPIPSDLAIIRQDNKKEKYSEYYQLFKELTTYYMYQLKFDTNSIAYKYVKNRNLSDQDIDLFKIGYCPENGKDSIKYLKDKGFSDDQIISCGVGVDVGKGNIVDRFRGRVIFCLSDSEGRVISFSGRKILNDESAKYVNGPETILFHKSNTLYNYHNAIINSKKDGYAYIVEGFMDAIALSKAGLSNVVATMGTAFTKDHIRLLKALKCQIRLFFDSDNPGQEATSLAVDALIDSGLDFKVVDKLVAYKDIDEALQKSSKEEVVKIANNLISPIQFKINYYANDVNFSNYDDSKKFVNSCLNFLSKIEIDELDKEYYCDQISKISRLNVNIIKSQLNSLSSNNRKKEDENFNEYIDYSFENISKHLDRYQQADHQILQKMIANEIDILKYRNDNISLTDRTSRKLANLIVDKYLRDQKVSFETLFNDADNEVAKLLGDLSRETYPEQTMDYLANIVGNQYTNEILIGELEEELKRTNDLEKQIEIAQKLLELKGIKK